MADFQISVKASADVGALQHWALSVLRTNDPGSLFYVDKIPGLNRVESQPISCGGSNENGKKMLALAWGGGFGHWGLIIGDSNAIVVSTETMDVIPWQPGIYFFRETK